MSHQNHYVYLTKRTEKQFVSRVCAVFAVIMPLTTIPQITLLYGTKNANGLSLAMWVMYTIGCVPFLFFGIVYKHKQIIILNSLWLVVQAIMITGILMYR